MANNQYVNKVQKADGTVIIDITDTTATASDVASGKYFYSAAGQKTLGTNQSGGGTSVQVGKTTKTLTSASSSISFTGLSGEPTSFVITSSADQSTGGTKVVSVAYDGTSLHGMDITTQAEADTGFTKSYAGGTLTVTATTAQFQANEYKLVYTYGGASSDIHTADVQVGSGATSITFTGISGTPLYFSCVFKSSFSTSSGYQRVIEVVNDGTNTYGHAMDSSAHSATYWTYTHNGGNLVISSQGTNQGGYFHQPGYYQLTYATDSSAPSLGTKSITANGTYNAEDDGYDGYSSVTVSVSGGGSASIDTKTVTNNSNTATSISFTSMKGTPKVFFVRCQTQIQSSGNTSYYYVDNLRYNGTNTQGTYVRIGSTRGIYPDTTHYSYSYSGTTLTITTSGSRTAAGGSFYNGTYELVYVY